MYGYVSMPFDHSLKNTPKMMSAKATITTNDGKVRGIRQTSVFSGTEFYSFFGIPYAQPPVAGLRFKDPVKVKPWKNIHDGTVEKPGCIQFSLRKVRTMGREDCLYINVHITELPKKGHLSRPVIVNIHPGAFLFGSPNEDHFGSPNYVMQNDIVYVCVSFRLHILGFLNLGLEDCSGNQGLKDVIMALEWIRDNITYFGGDPNNVTLLGSSSGSAMIHILMLSPKAKGLFHKAVMMGMYIFDPHIPFENRQESLIKHFVLELGYNKDINDKRKVLMFLKRLKPEVFLLQHRASQKKIHQDLAILIPLGAFLPTIDQGKNAILPESPRKLISSMMRIPLMIGFCDKESVMGFCAGELRKNTENRLSTSFCQNEWGWGYGSKEDEVSFINKKIEEFYNNGWPIERASLSLKIDIQTDIIMSDVYDTLIYPIATDLPSAVYVYQFDFEGDVQTIKSVVSDSLAEAVQGTFHADDYSYWSCTGETKDIETREMILTFTKTICTFAATGNPNYKNCEFHWRPTTPNRPCYLSLNRPPKMIDGILKNDRLQFWHELRKKLSKNR